MDSVVSTAFNLFVIGFLLFSNGFFVAAEFSMVKIRKTRIEELCKQGNATAKIALEENKDLDTFIAAVQLGVTISSIGLGWVGEATLAKMILPMFQILPQAMQGVATHTIAIGLAFAIITVMHVVIGELVPKSIALQYTEETTLAIARPMKVIMVLFAPFVWLLNGLGNSILKLLKIPQPERSQLVHSTEELDMLINASYNEGVLNETEKEMLHNTFKFSDLTAKEVMVPRTDMVCIPKDISYEELNKVACDCQYTRYPIFEEDIDHMIGLLHVKDLYNLPQDKTDFSLDKLMRPLLIVPEMITLDNIVREFKKGQKQMAVVIDEYGGTSGLITLEDEFDEAIEVDIKEVEENVYLANAMVRLDEMAEFFNVDEKEYYEEDVDTIGGLVLKILGRVAEVGDKVEWHNLTFEVKEIDGVRITKLLITQKPQDNIEETSE